MLEWTKREPVNKDPWWEADHCGLSLHVGVASEWCWTWIIVGPDECDMASGEVYVEHDEAEDDWDYQSVELAHARCEAVARALATPPEAQGGRVMERPNLDRIRARARMTNWDKERDVFTLCDYVEHLEARLAPPSTPAQWRAGRGTWFGAERDEETNIYFGRAGYRFVWLSINDGAATCTVMRSDRANGTAPQVVEVGMDTLGKALFDALNWLRAHAPTPILETPEEARARRERMAMALPEWDKRKPLPTLVWPLESVVALMKAEAAHHFGDAEASPQGPTNPVRTLAFQACTYCNRLMTGDGTGRIWCGNAACPGNVGNPRPTKLKELALPRPVDGKEPDYEWADDLVKVMVTNDNPRGILNLCLCYAQIRRQTSFSGEE